MRRIALMGVLMAFSEAEHLADRFQHARECLIDMFSSRRRPGRSYQGFIRAQNRLPVAWRDQIHTHLRVIHQRIAGRHWLVCGWPLTSRNNGREVKGWLAIAADGSRVEMPRTEANERAFGRAGRDKTGPQLAVTTLYHLGTGLPWAWKVGPGTDAERGHLMALLSTLPPHTLLVADAGFTGYDLLRAIVAGGHAFLIRVGSNVTLLTDLLKESDPDLRIEQQGAIVWLWPGKRRAKPPLKLRLIRIKRPAGESCDVYLLTNVLEVERLSDETAAALYRRRWGIEVFYRSYKQTMEQRKLRSRAPRQAEWELHWGLIGLLLLGLMSIDPMIQQGRDPHAFSPADALRTVRRAMWTSRRWRRRGDLRVLLAGAIQDGYCRTRPKKARDWPHKKNDPPPGSPQIRNATPKETLLAQRVYQAA